MASDTKKKKKSTGTNTSKKTKTTKKNSAKTKKKTNTTVKTTVNKNGKRVAATTKKQTAKKEPEKIIESKELVFEELEKGDPDLTKTAYIDPEVIQELHASEIDEIDKIKVEEKPIIKSKKNEIQAKTILGLDLPSGMNREDRDLRKKFYAKDALIFSIIIPILDLFAMLFIDSYTYLLITNSPIVNYIITLLLDFVLIFIVTYLIDYIFGEDAVKRINK